MDSGSGHEKVQSRYQHGVVQRLFGMWGFLVVGCVTMREWWLGHAEREGWFCEEWVSGVGQGGDWKVEKVCPRVKCRAARVGDTGMINGRDDLGMRA